MSDSKKIAVFVTSTGWGGLEMNTLKLSRLLKAKGFDLTLFTQDNSTIIQYHKDVFNQVEVIKKRRKYFDFKTARAISKRLKTNNINVVFVVDNKDLDVLAWTKGLFFKELKIIYQQHMQIGINKKDFLHTKRFKSIDTWISPLPFLKVEIGLRTHFPLKRVEVVPIGIDTSKFLKHKYSKQEAREKLGIHTDLPLLGIIGRISEKKGQKFVAEALLALKSKGSHVELVIFGSATINDEADKKYDQELRQFVIENDLSRQVHFTEYQEDVHQFYNSIDVFVLASHSETYGMVTIEAMLSGIPVIATNSGGTPGILGNGKLGHLYPFEDHDKFIKELKLVLNEMEKTRQMTSSAKEIAATLYDEKAELDSIVNILNRYLK
jgi:D-inositol-3-phosphate glycosyltransferase|tara:strand:+ start:33457 stop:34593 length:1137 start_codon:yes stop_codon:yes gene_type:complete